MFVPFRFEDPYDVFRHHARRAMQPTPGTPTMREGAQASVFPPVNIYDSGEGYMLRAEIPGVSKESLDISCKDNQLVIRGQRTVEAVEASANYHRREREAGQFRRAVTLPQPIDAARVEASYNNGILEIHAPRTEQVKARTIKIS